jgi:hypothetical protein
MLFTRGAYHIHYYTDGRLVRGTLDSYRQGSASQTIGFSLPIADDTRSQHERVLYTSVVLSPLTGLTFPGTLYNETTLTTCALKGWSQGMSAGLWWMC